MRRLHSSMLFMNKKSPYKLVDYIESTGEQYIDTQYTPNGDTSVEIDFQYAEIITSSRLFGSRTASGSAGGTDSFFISTITTTGGEYYFNYGNKHLSTGEKDANRHKWYIKKNNVYFDNAFIGALVKQTFVSPDTALLFGAFSGGAPAYTQAKIYSCKIWHNDTLVRDLKPCIRVADNKAGMYDAVSQQFFANKGTGDFIVGE